MKTALVTGANGFVGSYLCRELISSGYRVRALHRQGSDLSALKDVDVELCLGDVRSSDSLLAAMDKVDYVFHIAALFRQAKHPDSVYYDINVEGVKNVLDSAIQAGVKKVVHCSTVGVHSHIPNPPANESEAFRPGDVYQRTKCEGEKLAQSYFSEKKIDGCIIRPAMIWGPEDKRTLKLFRGIASRKFPLIGTGRTLLHWVLVSDLARAFRLAAETQASSGQVYIIAGERPVQMKELYSTIAEAYGVKPPRFAIPALPVQLLGSFVELVCKPLGIEPPIYRRRVDFFTKTRAFDWTKAKKELGYKPQFDFTSEVMLIAKWYSDQGWVSMQDPSLLNQSA